MKNFEEIVKNNKIKSSIIVIIILVISILGIIHHHNVTTIKDSSPEEVQKWVNNEKNMKYSDKKTIIYIYKNNEKSENLKRSVAKYENKFDGNIININLNNQDIQKVIKDSYNSDYAESIYKGAPSIKLEYKKNIIKEINGNYTVLTNKDLDNIFNTSLKKALNKINNEKEKEKKEMADQDEKDNQDEAKGVISKIIDRDNISDLSPELFTNGTSNDAFKEFDNIYLPYSKQNNDAKWQSNTKDVKGTSKINSIKKVGKDKWKVNYNANIVINENHIDTVENTSKTTEETKQINYEAIIIKQDNKFKLESNKQVKIISDASKEV